MRLPYLKRTTPKGQDAFMPFLPIKLLSNTKSIETYGLLDTGATINVLPYSLGLKLGAVWENQHISIPLSGNLAREDAKALLLSVVVGDYKVVDLAFAWSKSDNVPLILGQTNFFMEFDAFFSRSSLFFEVFPKNTYKVIGI